MQPSSTRAPTSRSATSRKTAAYENEDEAIVYALTGGKFEVKEEAPAPPANTSELGVVDRSEEGRPR